MDKLLYTPNLMIHRHLGAATSGYVGAFTRAQGSVRRTAVREEPGRVL